MAAVLHAGKKTTGDHPQDEERGPPADKASPSPALHDAASREARSPTSDGAGTGKLLALIFPWSFCLSVSVSLLFLLFRLPGCEPWVFARSRAAWLEAGAARAILLPFPLPIPQTEGPVGLGACGALVLPCVCPVPPACASATDV